MLVTVKAMSAERIETAITRIAAAMERIDAAHRIGAEAGTKAGAKAGAGPARVVELVNAHEKLREQVAESLRELDDLLEKLDDGSAPEDTP